MKTTLPKKPSPKQFIENEILNLQSDIIATTIVYSTDTKERCRELKKVIRLHEICLLKEFT